MRDYRGVFPGVFTMGNVVCGFFSILSTFEGHITTACWLLLFAALLDALDGKVARLSRSTSQFGIELDSLADFLSFGVAPSVIFYSITLQWLGKWGWIVSIVFIMAAAYRLARYNLMADTEEKKDFLGLPVPAAAMAILTFVIFCYHLWGGIQYHEFFITMILILSFLMVSTIQYDTMPDRFDTPAERIKLIVLVLVAIAVIFKPRLLLFPFVTAYILFGMIRQMYVFLVMGMGKVTGRTNGFRRLKGSNR